MPSRIASLGCLLTLGLSSCARDRAPTRPPTPIHRPSPTSTAVRLLDAHNAERERAGLPRLKLDIRLNAAARTHAERMASVGRLAHSGIGDGNPGERVREAGYEFARAAENVAWNQPDVPDALNGWMRSRGHRANVLGPFDEMGGGVAYGRNGDPYWCVTFGRRPLR